MKVENKLVDFHNGQSNCLHSLHWIESHHTVQWQVYCFKIPLCNVQSPLPTTVSLYLSNLEKKKAFNFFSFKLKKDRGL